MFVVFLYVAKVFSESVLVWNFPDRPRPSWNHSSLHNQFFARNAQIFRAHFKAHKRLLAFFLTKEILTHERIAVRNICMRFTSRLGEI